MMEGNQNSVRWSSGTGSRKVEEELALAKETILLLEGEVKVKCQDCNRHGAFEENVKLREELAEANDRANDFRLMLNEKTAQLEDVKRAYQKIEEERDRLRAEVDQVIFQRDSIHQQALEQEQQIAALTAEFEGMRKALEISKQQIAFLKSSLVSWRKREWPGTNQDAVIERDLGQISRQALGKEAT